MYWVNRKAFTGLLLLLCGFTFAQNDKVAFDVKITSKGRFNSAKDISESFLNYFRIPDSTNYSVFYSKDIFCLLIEEEIKNAVPTQKINSADELCQDSLMHKMFELTINKKRRSFMRSEGAMAFDDVEIIKFDSDKRKTESTSSYKFDLYDLRLHFKNKKTDKAYVLNMFDVYHINYKWYFLDPGFEVFPE